EHRIRLRGGWEYQNAGPAAGGGPITLPVRWDRSHAPRLSLSRRFGQPPIDTGSQCVLLELNRARGIYSLRLNGTTLAASSPEKSYYLIPLAEIEERNVLLLDVDTGAACKEEEADGEWGNIALVIRTREGPGAAERGELESGA